MTFIVRTRMGDIDVNPKGHRLGRTELLDRARRLVKRAREVGEEATVFERANGREVPVDVATGKYLTGPGVSNVVATGLQRRGGAGAGLHHTRTRDEAKGRARREKHGGRAGRSTRRNPEEVFEFPDLPPPGGNTAGGRPSRPQPGTAEWKALSREQKEEIQAEMALEVAATLQNVPLEKLKEVLRQGRPSYPASAAPVNPFNLQIFTDVEDVRVAAEALGIPVARTSATAPVDGTVVVSSTGAFPELSGPRVFRFPAADRRPMLAITELREKGEQPSQRTMGFFYGALGTLAGWINDNNFRKITIIAPTPSLVSRRGEAEIASGPFAGDVVYLLSTLFAGTETAPARTVPSSAIHAPVSGRVVDIQPAQIVLEEVRNYPGEFEAIVNKVNRARRALVEGRERVRSQFGRRRRDLEGQIERTTDDLLRLARGLKVTMPEVRTALAAEVSREKNRLLSQHAAALRAVGKQYQDSPIRYDEQQLLMDAAVKVSQAMGRRTDIYEYERGGEAESLQRQLTDLKGEVFRLAAQEGRAVDAQLDALEAEFFGRASRGGMNTPAIVPALSTEAHRGYPSLSSDATVSAVERAIRAIFGRPEAQVVVTVQGAPFTTILVPRTPENALPLAQLMGREKEIERDLNSLENQLRLLQARDPAAVAALLAQVQSVVSGDPSGVKFGDLFGAAVAGAVAEPSPEQLAAQEVQRAEQQGVAVSAELNRVHERVKDLTAELRRTQRSISDLATEYIKFSGSISLRIPVSLRSRSGRNLPVLPSVVLGSQVQEGQALTKADVVVEEVAKPVRPQRPIGAIPTSPRFLEKEAAAVANLKDPAPNKPVKTLHAAVSTNMREGDTGTFVVQRHEYEGTGEERRISKTEEVDVYATLVSPRPLNFEDVLQQVGGFGQFLVKFGYLAEAELPKIPEALRNSTKPSPQALEILIKSVIGTKNAPVVEWVTGKRNLNIMAFSPTPPAGVRAGQVTSTDVAVQGTIFPAYAAAGKPVRSADIERITMYTLRQDRPTEAAPVIMEFEDILTRGGSLPKAIARAANRQAELDRQAKAMARMIGNLSKAEEAALITAEDKAQAAARARAFGNTRRDIEYVTNRLLRASLGEAAAEYPEIRQAVAQEQGVRTSAVTKMAETLRRGNKAKYGPYDVAQIVQSFTPNRDEVEAGIVALRDKIADPKVTADPMMDVLLIAHQAPDSSGRPRDQFELIVDWRTLDLLRGQSGTGLARLIKAFEFAPQIGFVPREYPKTKAELSALKTFADARGLSTQSAVAAARLGLNFSPRGDFAVSKISPRGSRGGMDLPGGITIERGGRGGLPSDAADPSKVGAGTFGEIGSTRSSKSRREILMSRLPREVMQDVAAPMGRTSSPYERMKEKYARTVATMEAEGRHEQIPVTEREAAIVRAKNAAAIAAAVEAASGAQGPAALAEEAFFGDSPFTAAFTGAPARQEEEPEPVPASFGEAFSFDNPYRRSRMKRQADVRRHRLRRNPSVAEEYAAVRDLPDNVSGALEVVRNLLKVYGDPSLFTQALATPLVEVQAKSITIVGMLSAAASWAMSLAGDASADELRAIVSKLSQDQFLKSLLTHSFAGETPPPAIRVGGKDVALNKTSQSGIRAEFLGGFFYESDTYGALIQRGSNAIAEIVIYGPFAAAWTRANASRFDQQALTSIRSMAAPTALIDAVDSGIEALEMLVAQGAAAGAGERLGSARRLLVRTASGAAAVQEKGFILNDDSKKLVGTTAGPSAQPARSIADLHVQANDAYAAFLEAIMVTGRIDAERASSLARLYEAKLSELQRAISASPLNESPSFKSLVEARLVHFLTGRTRPGEERISKDRRLAALKGPLASYLDYYGRPLFPIPEGTLDSLGIPRIDYGDGMTLSSRITLPQARHIVDETSRRGVQRTPSTSTLDCKPGVGRGVNEFPRPYTGYIPAGWPMKGFLNVIWLSPDGQVARIYRLGASVCMFRRKPGEKLDEFLAEVAENWNLWLTDPEHQRMGRQYASEIWVGQSGAPYLFKINSSSDKANLSRFSFPRRLKESGGEISADGKHIVSKDADGTPLFRSRVEGGKIAVWAESDEVQADARIFIEAMKAAGLLSDEDADKAFSSVLGGFASAGAAQAASASASKKAAVADLVVLAPATTYRQGGEEVAAGGTPTIPTTFKSTVGAFLLNPASPFKKLRIHDRSFTGAPRRVSIMLAERMLGVPNATLTPEQAANKQTMEMLNRSAAGVLMIDALARKQVEGQNLRVIAGEAPAKEKAREGQVERASDGLITFDQDAGRLSFTFLAPLLETALLSAAPIMVVELQDVPTDRSNAERDGLAMLFSDDPGQTSVYKILMKKGTALDVPVVYAYPEVRGAYNVDSRLADIKGKIAAELNVAPEQVPLTAIAFENLNELGQRALTRRAANPRQRMVRQVAAQWMRTYPFVG